MMIRNRNSQMQICVHRDVCGDVVGDGGVVLCGQADLTCELTDILEF